MHVMNEANGPEGGTDWQRIDWRKAERAVRNLRQRIFRASQQGNLRKVHMLQKLMLRSYSNTLVSVRRVTQQNAGRYTPGVDKVVVKTPRARGYLVDLLLTKQPWRVHPARRVYIPKATGGRKRWVVDADIKGCFDHVSHTTILDAIGAFPARELIKQWLKAGYMDHGVFQPTPTGTGQGSVISPLLANVALHGMEEALAIRRRRNGGITGTRALVRYADDFCVFCETQEDAQVVVELLTTWLAGRGLTLSAEKTRIVHLDDGFDFLGFTIKQYSSTRSKTGRTLHITPSKASIKALRRKVDTIWKHHYGAPVAALIAALNPVIRGWAAYFRIAIASKVFSALDSWMFLKAVRWVNHTHPQQSVTWKQAHYWGRLNPKRADGWVFGNKATGAYLLKFKWVAIQRHVIVRGTASPDDPALRDYWWARERAKARDLVPSKALLALQQHGLCSVCGVSLFTEEEVHVHHLVPRAKGGTDVYTNLRLVHYYCHQQLHATANVGAKEPETAERRL